MAEISVVVAFKNEASQAYIPLRSNTAFRHKLQIL